MSQSRGEGLSVSSSKGGTAPLLADPAPAFCLLQLQYLHSLPGGMQRASSTEQAAQVSECVLLHTIHQFLSPQHLHVPSTQYGTQVILCLSSLRSKINPLSNINGRTMVEQWQPIQFCYSEPHELRPRVRHANRPQKHNPFQHVLP